MSVILLLRSDSCAYTEVDSRLDLRPITHDLPRAEAHFSWCTRSWHLTDAAVAVLQAWAVQYRHTVIDKRDDRR